MFQKKTTRIQKILNQGTMSNEETVRAIKSKNETQWAMIKHNGHNEPLRVTMSNNKLKKANKSHNDLSMKRVFWLVVVRNRKEWEKFILQKKQRFVWNRQNIMFKIGNSNIFTVFSWLLIHSMLQQWEINNDGNYDSLTPLY